MEFYQVYEKSNFFIRFIKTHIFVETVYQLKKFDMNFKGCHHILAVYLAEIILGNW